ncbi:MAG: hypothetical protein A2056_02395 [Deltaproteobacteria bacterium GWA2_42_85]|nr:MAG: hypothetical protein A2056_02395 [Deltaproteobacteria bacterium GWA2_42_85]OGP43682.1 MAG: hypothetical protein A2090_05830 [Deltaproteobacteria bacterium GWD2_42_10]
MSKNIKPAPECFNQGILDSRLKTAGMTILIKEVFSGKTLTSLGSQRGMKIKCRGGLCGRPKREGTSPSPTIIGYAFSEQTLLCRQEFPPDGNCWQEETPANTQNEFPSLAKRG